MTLRLSASGQSVPDPLTRYATPLRLSDVGTLCAKVRIRYLRYGCLLPNTVLRGRYA